MRFYAVAGILLGMVCCVFAEKVALEQVYLNNDYVTDRHRRSAAMPQRLYYDMKTDDGLIVRLNLTQIDQLPTTVVKGGKSTELFKSGDNMAAYVDRARDGVFMIENKLDSNGQSYYHLVGVFQFGRDLVMINPRHPSARSVYTIEPINGIVDNRNDYILPPGYVPPPPNTRRALVDYVVEISFLADFAIYQKFLIKNNNNEAATDTEMRVYYAFHAEQLKDRYRSVNQIDPEISIVPTVKKLIIFKDPADVPFVENNKIDATSINSSLVIYRAKDYLAAIPAGVQIPRSDHYMVFSGYDLVSSGGGRGNAGIAFTGTVCNPIFAVSLVEDSQKELTAIVAAHELGHGLGSRHDSDIGCDNSAQNIMAAVTRIVSDTAAAKRQWMFSTCSVAAFKRTLATKSCLNDNTGTPEFTTRPKLGQIYSRDQQCKFVLGENSVFRTTTPIAEQCYRMQCAVQVGNRFRFNLVLPFDYTDCGANQWCFQGECIAKSSGELTTTPQTVTVRTTTTTTTTTTTAPTTTTTAPTTTNQPPRFNQPVYNLRVQEGPKGQVLSRSIAATDPNGDQITYRILNTSPGIATNFFIIDPNTAVLSYRQDYRLSLNLPTRVTMLISAVDTRGLSNNALVIVRIRRNQTQSSQVTITNRRDFAILHRFNPPTVIYTVQAVSTNPSATLTYSLQSDLFRIDSLSGVISVIPGVTLSNLITSQKTITVTVVVSDGSSTATRNLILVVF